MSDRDLPDFDAADEPEDRPELLKKKGLREETETIDLNRLFDTNLTDSGSFDLRGRRETSLVRLLHALPVCALLVDASGQVVVANEFCQTLGRGHRKITGSPFASLFLTPEEAERAAALIDEVLLQHKSLVSEGVIALDKNKIWVRLHLRSLRIAHEMQVLVLLQDLTLEKKQLLLTRKHEQALRSARDELELRVRERTAELRSLNERLGKEVFERQQAQQGLQRAKEELELRVEKRTAELTQAVDQLRGEIARRAQAELDFQQSKEMIEALFNATTDIVFLVDREGTLLAYNTPFSEWYGVSADECLGRQVYDLLPGEAGLQLRGKLAEVVEGMRAIRYENRLRGRILDNSLYPVMGSSSNVEGVAVFSRDVTEARHAEAELHLAAKIVESSNEGIVVTDRRGNIVDVNHAFCELTGFSREEVIGENPRVMKSDRHPPDFYRDMWTMLLETGHWFGEVWDRRKNGEVFPKLLSISAVKDNSGRVTHYVGIFSDITKIKDTEARLEQLAHYDSLTKLPNRLLFRDRFHYALVETGRHRHMVALMLLDLDRFKNINDTLGHKAGDDLLVAAAQRLTSRLRKSDTVARLGGDEFAVVLAEVDSGRAASFVATQLINALSDPFDLDGREVFVTVSIGITLYPLDGTNVDRLLQNADMALYRAKEQGRNDFRFFSPEMNREVADRLELESSLRHALARQEFLVYYQPRLDCQTGTIIGVEALLRWKHPERGVLSPVEFISAAEETGLIVPLGEWVLRTACRQKREWQAGGLPHVTMAVNVSARQLAQTDLVDVVVNAVRESGVDPTQLELELTESLAMRDPDVTIQILRELKGHGIQTCIDDFGTGYSSLSYLKRFPISKLKIDKSFVEFSSSDPDDQAIVETIVAMAHSLKLGVVAEGVETQEQLRFLQGLGCDEWQGFHCSRPVPAEQLGQMLADGWTCPH